MSLGTIYISGKISGENPEAVRKKFDDAERYLRALGYETVNPLKNGLDNRDPWEAHMAFDIHTMLYCGSIYMLSDWPHSRGARLEYGLAKLWGKAILYEEATDMERLVLAVEKVFDTQLCHLRGRDRKHNLVSARIVFAGIATEMGIGAGEIGLQLRRDRSTIIYYTHQYDNGLKYSEIFRRKVAAVKKLIPKHD